MATSSTTQQTPKTVLESVKKFNNNGYWSAKYLKNYIETTLSEGGKLGDIFTLDVANYKKLDGFTDKLPIKFRPCKGANLVAFKLDTKVDKHTGVSYSKEFDSGFIKIAKFSDTSLFTMDNDKYRMKDDVEPTADQFSPTFAVMEHVIHYAEAELAALIESGTIALPIKGKKKEKVPSDAKIILRSKNDSLNTPIRYETKGGEEMCNPTALIKFQKDRRDDGTSYRLNQCVDASPDAEERGARVVLTGKNISQMIVPQTTIRALIALNAINIYEQGISIACYVDSIQFARPERKVQTDIGFDSEADEDEPVTGEVQGSLDF